LDIFDDFNRFAAMGALQANNSTLQKVWNGLPPKLKDLENSDWRRTTLSFSALQLLPELQYYSVRFQMIALLAFLFCTGTKKLNPSKIAKHFTHSNGTSISNLEDPPEDVFCSNICTDRGEFLILESTHEGGAFYVQRLVNIIQEMPDEASYEEHFRGPIFALLKLSDVVLKKANLSRNQFSEPIVSEQLSSEIIGKIRHLKNVLSISNAELKEFGISREYLAKFDCKLLNREKQKAHTFGNTILNFYPVYLRQDGVDLIFPNLISTAIRGFITESICQTSIDIFNRALLNEYAQLISLSPYENNVDYAAPNFEEYKNVWISNIMRPIDTGRYMHILYFLDNLEDFMPENFGGFGKNKCLGEVIENSVKLSMDEAHKDADFKEGITLIVACGIGRGIAHSIPRTSEASKWHIDTIAIHDLETAYWHPDHSDRLLWQAIKAEKKAIENNIQIININGLLNLVAWQQRMSGNMVPEAELPHDYFPNPDTKLMLRIPTDEILNFRIESRLRKDQSVHLDWKHEFRTMIIPGETQFSPRPTYLELNPQKDKMLSVVPDKDCNIWFSIIFNDHDDLSVSIEHQRMMMTWIPRISNMLSDKYFLRKLPRALLLEFHFDIHPQSFVVNELNYDDQMKFADFIKSNKISDDNMIKFKVQTAFYAALYSKNNTAERCLVESILHEINTSFDLKFDMEELASSILIGNLARHSHAFKVDSFRLHFHDQFQGSPIEPSLVDHSNVKLGMSWIAREDKNTQTIKGVKECCNILNQIVTSLQSSLVKKIRNFAPEIFLHKVLDNYDHAYVVDETWKRTSASITEIAEDEESAYSYIIKHKSKLTSNLIAYRVLLEIGQVECGKQDQKKLGNFDLSEMMATVTEIFQLGNASDAIRYGVMEPKIRLTPLGDVLLNWDFQNSTVTNMGLEMNKDQISKQIKNYDKFFEEDESATSKSVNLTENTDPYQQEFCTAFLQEVGCSLEILIEFVAFLLDTLIQKEIRTWDITIDEFYGYLQNSTFEYPDHLNQILDAFAMPTRKDWRVVPEGYLEKDIQPWKFRRMLSILRKPILRYKIADQNRIMINGGLLKDALDYTFDRYLDGEFNQEQLKSNEMKRWFGKVASENVQFNKLVVKKLRSLGLEAKDDTNLSELINGSKDIVVDEYKASGDVDALAWDTAHGAVYVIECKQLQTKKTPGEMAEQLSKYSGEGKQDKLRKHLARLFVLRRHKNELSKKLGFEVKHVHGAVIFSNHVPMQFDKHVSILTPVIRLNDLDKKSLRYIDDHASNNDRSKH